MQGFDFEEIYGRFHRPIFSYVRSKVSDEEIARELTQEIFLKVHRFRAHYKEEYALSTWLWTIARNCLHDHFRSKWAKNGEFTEESVEELPSSDRCAEGTIVKREELRELFGRLKILTHLQRRVIWMQFVHQLSHAEIARRLDTTLDAVRNAAFRARGSLAENWTLTPASA